MQHDMSIQLSSACSLHASSIHWSTLSAATCRHPDICFCMCSSGALHHMGRSATDDHSPEMLMRSGGLQVIQVCRQANPRIEVQRARFSALVLNDLRRAVNNLVPPSENESVAVDARQELDLRIGASFTRFQTKLLQVLPMTFMLAGCLVYFSNLHGASGILLPSLCLALTFLRARPRPYHCGHHITVYNSTAVCFSSSLAKLGHDNLDRFKQRSLTGCDQSLIGVDMCITSHCRTSLTGHQRCMRRRSPSSATDLVSSLHWA